MYLNFVKKHIKVSRIIQTVITLTVIILHFDYVNLLIFGLGTLLFGMIIFLDMKFVSKNSESIQSNGILIFIDLAFLIYSFLAVYKGELNIPASILWSSMRYPYIEFARRYNVS